MPSMPGAPLLRRTCFNARSRLFLSSTRSINDEQKVDFGSTGFPISDSPSELSRGSDNCLTGAIQKHFPSEYFP